VSKFEHVLLVFCLPVVNFQRLLNLQGRAGICLRILSSLQLVIEHLLPSLLLLLAVLIALLLSFGFLCCFIRPLLSLFIVTLCLQFPLVGSVLDPLRSSFFALCFSFLLPRCIRHGFVLPVLVFSFHLFPVIATPCIGVVRVAVAVLPAMVLFRALTPMPVPATASAPAPALVSACGPATGPFTLLVSADAPAPAPTPFSCSAPAASPLLAPATASFALLCPPALLPALASVVMLSLHPLVALDVGAATAAAEAAVVVAVVAALHGIVQAAWLLMLLCHGVLHFTELLLQFFNHRLLCVLSIHRGGASLLAR
jgi:hypothetical protein